MAAVAVQLEMVFCLWLPQRMHPTMKKNYFLFINWKEEKKKKKSYSGFRVILQSYTIYTSFVQ